MIFLNESLYSFYQVIVVNRAAGNCNESLLNNIGINGKLWSSSLNENNSTNGRNLNFNYDGNLNDNNNNRYYGQSVRGVALILYGIN